jgi:hypothetical protein
VCRYWNTNTCRSKFVKSYYIVDCLGTEVSKLIEEHSPCHLFLDEAPACDLSPEVWSDIHKKFPKDNFLWVAYRADTSPHDDAVEGKFTGTQCTNWSSY